TPTRSRAASRRPSRLPDQTILDKGPYGALKQACSRSRGDRLALAGAREPDPLVFDLAALQHEDVARVVLVQPPRCAGPLLRELVDRAHHIAGVEVDERLARQ